MAKKSGGQILPMTFINRNIIVLAQRLKSLSVKCYLLVILSLLSACQFIPASEGVGDGEGEPVSAAEQRSQQDGEQVSEAPIRLPNPYLSNRSAVPAEARSRFQSAREYLESSQWQLAEEQLLWLTQHHATLSGPWINLALLYSELNQLDKVAPAFEQAITANRNNVNAYNQYGIFLRGQGLFAEAEKQYLQALDVWPDYPEGHLNLAILYDLYMGQLAPALEHYLTYQALQEEPDRQVAGWIVDTQRRLKSQSANVAGEP